MPQSIRRTPESESQRWPPTHGDIVKSRFDTENVYIVTKVMVSTGITELRWTHLLNGLAYMPGTQPADYQVLARGQKVVLEV